MDIGQASQTRTVSGPKKGSGLETYSFFLQTSASDGALATNKNIPNAMVDRFIVYSSKFLLLRENRCSKQRGDKSCAGDHQQSISFQTGYA
jgi:hypothetical protein